MRSPSRGPPQKSRAPSSRRRRGLDRGPLLGHEPVAPAEAGRGDAPLALGVLAVGEVVVEHDLLDRAVGVADDLADRHLPPRLPLAARAATFPDLQRLDLGLVSHGLTVSPPEARSR